MKSHKKIFIILMPMLIYSSCTTMPVQNQSNMALAQIQSVQLDQPLKIVRSKLGNPAKIGQLNWYGQSVIDWTYDLKNHGSIELFADSTRQTVVAKQIRFETPTPDAEAKNILDNIKSQPGHHKLISCKSHYGTVAYVDKSGAVIIFANETLTYTKVPIESILWPNEHQAGIILNNFKYDKCWKEI